MDMEQEKQLRIQFAMHAMQGILANDVCMHQILELNDNAEVVAKAVAERAFLYADAMLLRV